MSEICIENENFNTQAVLDSSAELAEVQFFDFDSAQPTENHSN
jgi:hypothetical protein